MGMGYDFCYIFSHNCEDALVRIGKIADLIKPYLIAKIDPRRGEHYYLHIYIGTFVQHEIKTCKIAERNTNIDHPIVGGCDNRVKYIR